MISKNRIWQDTVSFKERLKRLIFHLESELKIRMLTESLKVIYCLWLIKITRISFQKHNSHFQLTAQKVLV